LKLMNVAHRLDNGELLLLGTVLGLAVALPLSVWIVRAAWRAAARPVSAGPSSRP
jgi:hypothetical protein